MFPHFATPQIQASMHFRGGRGGLCQTSTRECIILKWKENLLKGKRNVSKFEILFTLEAKKELQSSNWWLWST